jgi:hypothetical protein
MSLNTEPTLLVLLWSTGRKKERRKKKKKEERKKERTKERKKERKKEKGTICNYLVLLLQCYLYNVIQYGTRLSGSASNKQK